MTIETVAAWSAIIIAAVGAVSTVCVALINSYSNYLLKKIDKKQIEEQEKKQQINQKSIIHEISSTQELKVILTNIQEITGCDRTNIWMFHNGGYFYTGEPIQRMTMISEYNKEGVYPLKHKFIGVPIRIFARNLTKLAQSKEIEFVNERNELAYNDALSIINQEADVTSSYIFKIKSSDNKDWTGVLCLGWLTHKELIETQIEEIQNKCKIISNILTPEYLKNDNNS